MYILNYDDGDGNDNEDWKYTRFYSCVHLMMLELTVREIEE